MLDLEKELKRMSEAYNIPEKEDASTALKNFRFMYSLDGKMYRGFYQ